VVRSIVEYSIPRLIGWTVMIDHSLEQAVEASLSGSSTSSQGGSYNGPSGGGVPF
jgi:hypothetical protein